MLKRLLFTNGTADSNHFLLSTGDDLGRPHQMAGEAPTITAVKGARA